MSGGIFRMGEQIKAKHFGWARRRRAEKKTSVDHSVGPRAMPGRLLAHQKGPIFRACGARSPDSRPSVRQYACGARSAAFAREENGRESHQTCSKNAHVVRQAASIFNYGADAEKKMDVNHTKPVQKMLTLSGKQHPFSITERTQRRKWM